MKKISDRAAHAAERLQRLKAFWENYDGNRAIHLQLLGAWEEIATPGEIKKNWRKWYA